ncbi:MAG TPA: YkgJ family cysteine cluster protein [Allosphingosinicella sp.]|jgi:hypothetical protein|nr:YkgJ family cysteine cluster protein [Allosphingosinicella sp.]
MVENEKARLASTAHLCLRCGLCCSGVIFDDVPVQEEEAGRLKTLGFDVRQQKDALRFRQPCTLFSGVLCSVYAERPAACRKFECKLLRRHQDHQVSDEEASSVVDAAKALVERLQPFLEKGESVASARKRWQVERQQVAGGSGAIGDSDQAQFHLHMATLNIFLDKHFRADGRHMMTGKPVASRSGRT